MAEAAAQHNPELAQSRLLTEVNHFLDYLDEYGNVPQFVWDDVVQNRMTGSQEIAMPYAVTTTYHDVITKKSEAGRQERLIMWLGRTATEVALSGHEHHFSAAAHRRVDVEVAEAGFVQDKLRVGTAQMFISPRMQPADASIDVAKAEHLYDDDSLRVSFAVTDADGSVVRRKLQSLLVRHVPFGSWLAMLRDPNNVFGKALPVNDAHSAISVMELFDQMELPETAVPEGPVSLVAAVIPYISNELARQKVRRQLARFRGDQEFYADEAAAAAEDWAAFDLELARSMASEQASDDVRFFIMQNAGAWNDESLEILKGHQLPNGHYAMTNELAALLARAKQKLVGDELSVVTDNDLAIQQLSTADRTLIAAQSQEIRLAREQGADPIYIRSLQQNQYQALHRNKIQSGGGCSGQGKDAFGRGSGENGVGEQASPFKNGEGKNSWNWKKGVCQVQACPSPKPTEVGPCSVCRRCQKEFDAGRDPTKEKPRIVPAPKRQKVGSTIINLSHKRLERLDRIVSKKVSTESAPAA